jgi:predicted PurR-regulated permease PerM
LFVLALFYTLKIAADFFLPIILASFLARFEPEFPSYVDHVQARLAQSCKQSR